MSTSNSSCRNQRFNRLLAYSLLAAGVLRPDAAVGQSGETQVPWLGIPGVWIATARFDDRLDERDSEDGDGDGDADDDCGGDTEGPMLSSAPVDVAGGLKHEAATDFVVRLTGRDFVMRRSYTSDSRIGGNDPFDLDYIIESWPPLTDRISPTATKWVFSPFQQLQHVIDNDEGHIVFLVDARRIVVYSTDDAPTLDTVWSSGGPSTERFERSFVHDLDADSDAIDSVATMRLYKPGSVERHFYRPIREVSGTPVDLDPLEFADNVPGYLWGRLAQERDTYGNRWDYDWEYSEFECGEEVFVPELSITRLRGIRCINADGKLEAEIRFDYELTPSGASTEAERRLHPTYGKLRRVRVLRPLAATTNVRSFEPPDLGTPNSTEHCETQRVELTYFEDVSGNEPERNEETFDCEEPTLPLWTAAAPTFLGQTGDLVQVATFERLDGGTAEHPTAGALPSYPAKLNITQYRYYANSGDRMFSPEAEVLLGEVDMSGDPEGDGADDDADGTDRQLRLVIKPQQVEYFAQSRNTEGMSPARETLYERAEELLGLDFNGMFGGLTGDDHIVLDLAAKVIVYGDGVDDELRRVEKQFVSAVGCGCGSAGGQQLSLLEEWSYFGVSDDFQGDEDPTIWTSNRNGYSQTTRVVEKLRNSMGVYTLHRTRYTDFKRLNATTGASTYEPTTPYVVNEAIVDSSNNKWVWHYAYTNLTSPSSEGRDRARVFLPSAMDSYSPGSAGSGPDYQAKADAGLVYGTIFNTEHRPTAFGVSVEGWGGSWSANDDFAVNTSAWSSDFVITEARTYHSGANQHLVATIELHRAAGASTDDQKERREFAYGFYGETEIGHDIAYVVTEVEAELESENGPGGVRQSARLFDDTGNEFWSFDFDDTATYREFNPLHGGVTVQVNNADASSESFDSVFDGLAFLDVDIGASPGGGGALRATFDYDPLGRPVRATSPSGVTTYARRELRDINSRPSLAYCAELQLPPRDGSSYEFGPGKVIWMDATGAEIGTDSAPVVSYTIYSGGAPTDYQPLVTAVSFEDPIARRRSTHSVAGELSSDTRWHDIGGNGSYTTSYKYDAKGRLIATVTPTGTVVSQTYDVLDRAVSESMGVATDLSDALVTSQYFYDDPTPEDGTLSQGVGDGNLTGVRRNGDAAPDRDTKLIYDGRNRLVRAINPEKPHELRVYDNLDRIVERGLFSGSTPPSSMTESNRGFYETTAYSQRGLVFRSRIAIDPDSSTPEFLATNYWFDADGRVIEAWGPNGPATKTSYDGLGRTKSVHLTDRAGDAAPGDTDNYDDAVTLDGDRVVEETVYSYHAGSASTSVVHAGLVELVATYRRAHDAISDTGALTALAASKSVVTWMGYAYDEADRPVETLDFGTNNTASSFSGDYTGVFATGSPPSVSSPADGTLVWVTAYGDRGQIDTVTDPSNPTGLVTKHVYDDLGRQIAVIENWDSGAVARDGTFAWGWKLTIASSQTPEQDRTTITTYDGNDNVTFHVAAFDDGAGTGTVAYQDTVYTYGVTTSTSEVNSNDLLAVVAYPDSARPNPGTDVVSYAYNRQGELINMTDQAGTIHAYGRDNSGRVVSDSVTFPMGTQLDTSAQEIRTIYDDFGRRWKVITETLSNATLNAVQYSYNGLWQANEVLQNPTGATGSGHSSPVTISYDDADTDAGNYSRPLSIGFPAASGHADRTVVSFGYGAGGSLDSRISRAKTIEWDRPAPPLTDPFPGDPESHIVSYDWVGMDILARKDLDFVSIDLRRHMDPSVSGSPTIGTYPGYDRFGRVRVQAWLRDSWAFYASGPPTSGKPPIFEFRYLYDADSDLRWRWDTRGLSGGTLSTRNDRDERYTHDGLHRLTQADRGQTSSHTGSPSWSAGGSDGQEWTLDAIGNWTQVVWDSNGNGTYNGAGADLLDFRVHSAVNEIESRNVEYALGAGDFEYDPVGNLRTREVDTGGMDFDIWRYTYDAWNRLVKVEIDPESANSWQTRATYSYNGLHWRVTRHADSNANGTLDQGTLFYYDSRWRLLEDRTDDGFSSSDASNWANNFVSQRFTQRIWGLEYIDELLYVQTDTLSSIGGVGDGRFYGGQDAWYAVVDRMYSVLGLVDLSGTIAERVRYTQYGEGRHEWLCDTDGNGNVSNADENPVYTASIGGPGGGPSVFGTSPYSPDYDFDQDGDVDSVDNALIGAANPTSKLTGGRISASTVRNIVGFSGYLYDPAVDMYYARHRWYDPRLGRWISRDFVYDDLNVYAFCRALPHTYLDPMGTSVILPRTPFPEIIPPWSPIDPYETPLTPPASDPRVRPRQPIDDNPLHGPGIPHIPSNLPPIRPEPPDGPDLFPPSAPLPGRGDPCIDDPFQEREWNRLVLNELIGPTMLPFGVWSRDQILNRLQDKCGTACASCLGSAAWSTITSGGGEVVKIVNRILSAAKAAVGVPSCFDCTSCVLKEISRPTIEDGVLP